MLGTIIGIAGGLVGIVLLTLFSRGAEAVIRPAVGWIGTLGPAAPFAALAALVAGAFWSWRWTENRWAAQQFAADRTIHVDKPHPGQSLARAVLLGYALVIVAGLALVGYAGGFR